MKTDAIVVFGGGIQQSGELTADSRVRVECALRLWSEGNRPPILFSGKWAYSRQDRPVKTEAAAMAELALNRGLPADSALLEEESTDTLGNAVFTKKNFALPRRWKRLTVVVADYHLVRSQYICQRVFGPQFEIEFQTAPYDCSAEERRRLRRRGQAAQALLSDWLRGIADGDHRAILNIMSTQHPGYATPSRYSVADVAAMIQTKERQFANSRGALRAAEE